MPSVGSTYVDILGAMLQGVRPEGSGTVFHIIRKTVTGGVPLPLGNCEVRAKLQEAIEKAVGKKVDIRAIVPKMRVEVLDPDKSQVKACQ